VTSCWVTGADGHPDFPLHNLPLGVFSLDGRDKRIGVAIGSYILDLSLAAPYLGEAVLTSGDTLNALFAAGPGPRIELREAVTALLTGAPRPELLHLATSCQLHLPVTIGDYTDFYAGIHHATAVGKLFRPDSPLLPNYKYVPIGYHGRASSVRPSGVPMRRPQGQRRATDGTVPTLGPSRNLDYELELGIWVATGNSLGEPVSIAEAETHIAGYCLLNDWSARDIQGWEYQPLGPFLAKSFHTTVSPWVITPEALAPFRTAQPQRPAGDPAPLPYLQDASDQASGALSLELSVHFRTAAMVAAGIAPVQLSRSRATDLYWTPAQLVAHHTVGGCNLRPGDLLGTGTISGPGEGESGSLLELTAGGTAPLVLPNGESRRFLEDGDEVSLAARAVAPGIGSIGFGSCLSVILPATGFLD